MYGKFLNILWGEMLPAGMFISIFFISHMNLLTTNYLLFATAMKVVMLKG